MATQYKLSPGSLASNCYPATPQILYNEMFAKGFVTLDIQGVIRSQSTPAATDRDKLWIKIDGSSFPVGQFVFQGGLWIWPHEIPINDKRVFMFSGSAAEVDTLDGGSTATVGDSSGPFWEIISAWEGRSPIGVGTIPGRTLSPTSTSVGDDIGEAEHTQTQDELVPHTHTYNDRPYTLSGISLAGGSDVNDDPAALTGSTGGGDPFNIIQPSRAVYFISRTARKFRVG